ncbi:MAG: cytochrome c553 [Saprospiraceae bacterium]|jgi:cytochrome c553
MNTKIYITVGIFSLIMCASLIPVRNEANTFHTESELAAYEQILLSPPPPPVDSALIFPKSTACEGCHGFDEAEFAYVTQYGEEVNVFDDWQATMMANSAKDPFWRAKVSHEVLLHPDKKEGIETKCTSCHAPQGHYTAILRGEPHYTMADLLLDTIGLDGVGCGSCHMMSATGLGDLNSGNINYDTTRTIYGPFPGPFAGPMMEFVGYTPTYAPHIQDAGLCASCHSLLTETHDLEGNSVGTEFVEQATYQEWQNSFYEEEQSCQHCHIPQLEEEIVISSGYSFLEGRAPFGRHDLVGANTLMLGLMQENKEALGIEASDEDYAQTIQKTFDLLQGKSLDLTLEYQNETVDSLFFALELENKAGHKFPSGYPSRRVTVEFVVTTEMGDTLFQSGVHEPDYEVKGRDDDFENHYDVINSEEQVQIYEMVIGDVNGDPTTVLIRGDSPLKDNRLAPLGFTTTHVAYDTVRIVGQADFDANFNKDNGVEGTGKDSLFYHIPLNGYFGAVNVSAKVWYQSLPPAWMTEMFAETTPEIETFRTMFDNADRSPVLVEEQTLAIDFVGVSAVEKPTYSADIQTFPNPTTGWITLDLPENAEVENIEIRNVNGQKIGDYSRNDRTFLLPAKGVYLISIYDNEGNQMTKRVVME